MPVAEQVTSAKVVEVEDVAFFDYPDGIIEYGPALRRDLAREIRRYRPDLIGIESLRAHQTYLDGLGRDFDPAEFLHGMTIEPGRAIGVRNAVAFGRVQLHGV